MGPGREQRDATFGRLAQHFFRTFPQLEGIRFTHRWGGPIDTCSRFFAFYGLAHKAESHMPPATPASGSAPAASARESRSTCSPAATRRRRVRDSCGRRPLPFPPEPLRWAVIQATRRALARADRRQGRRGPLLRLLDRLGVGYDS